MAKNGQTKNLLGAAVGAGGSTAAGIAIRQIFKDKPTMVQWSDGIGAGLGALSGAAMLLLGKKKGWKDAGYVTILSALLSSGLRQVETMAFKNTYAAAAAAAAAAAKAAGGGMGLVDIERTTALRDAVIDPTTVLSGNDMPQLVGANLAAANAHVQLVGAPPLAEHSGHWGATLFNR